MSSLQPNLDRECDVFTRMLVDRSATPYVRNKYAEAHEQLPELLPQTSDDALLIRTAAMNPYACRLVDAYARHFAFQATLRKKLVLLLGILECSDPFSEHFDRYDGESLPIFTLKCGGILLAAVVSLLGGVMLVMTARALSRMV